MDKVFCVKLYEYDEEMGMDLFSTLDKAEEDFINTVNLEAGTKCISMEAAVAESIRLSDDEGIEIIIIEIPVN